MAIIKCKMCGGDIELSADKTFGTCEYCGCTMTLPKIDDDQRAAAFNRGNHFRRTGDFDKALAVYERIVQEDDNDAEAHWCCVLCRFGIEYVEDPTTYEYIPTCHRASFDNILEDVDYLAAVEHSEGITRRQYQKDAAKIAEVQRGILATSQKEEPFDVFICYKETDDTTKDRTKDSLDAQDIYYKLTEEGYRVFFSRITLEDKVGAEYEPYIFAALNSAKVMIALGSKPEYFSAVWVKNEWSRFLALMKEDRSKLLLPCYKNMDPYDLPEQLSVLQSYDMTKIGFMQDLIRGIKKVLAKDEPKPVTVQQTVPAQQTTGTMRKRGEIFLADGEWISAAEYFEKALDEDPEDAAAYLGKALASCRVSSLNDAAPIWTALCAQKDFQRAQRYADPGLSAQLAEARKKVEKIQTAARLKDDLLRAIDQNDTEALADVLRAGADVNTQKLAKNETVPALISAISKGSIEMVRLLLEKGADPNAERIFDDGRRFSALRDSIAEWPNDEIARLLIERGADVNYVEQNESVKCPVLISAIFEGNVSMVRLLLDKGADPNGERLFDDGRRFSALRDSIAEWPNDEIAQLLIEAGANVNYVGRIDGVNVPILNSAICKKNVPMVRLLLEKGADPNAERIFDDGRRFSALRDSIAEWPNDEIARLLIERGADVNYVEQNESVKCPVLISAIFEGNVSMVRLLLDKGADPNGERLFDDGRRFSALRDSILEWPNDEIARLLVERGANVNYVARNDGFWIPVLISAICKRNVNMVCLLLNKGANPYGERIFDDGRRFTALHDSISEWPNDNIASLLALYLTQCPPDVSPRDFQIYKKLGAKRWKLT